jgi:parallel beta-helix repeat protein
VGWDFYSQSSAFNNTITNLTTNDTNSSFTYNGSIYLKSATGAGLTDPVRYSNISHYLNITNGTAGAWLFINISYTDSDVPALLTNTSTIQIWKYSSGQWWNSTYVGTPDSIDTTNKYVYANITNFSSIYAPMGSTTGGNVSGCRVLGGGGTYNLTANLSGISDSSCLNITVGDMVLDCKGYSISANASGQDYGIYAGSSTNVTIKNCNIIDYGTAQIYFDTVAGPNTIQNCTIGNSTQSILRGIWLAGGGTTSTTITNNTIYGATQYDLRLGLGGGNIIVNTVIGNVNPTNINLTYKGSVGVKAASFPAPPTDFRLLGRAVDVTNLSSGSSAVLNVSYLTSDIPTDVLEANLKMAKNNGSWYTDPTTFASSNGVDTGNHYVWANITTFGSQFGPLGISQNVSACRTINVAGTYNLTGNLSGAGQLCGGTSCCINIAVGGVVFDCKGFSIVASAPVQNLGVYSNSASTTIQNCDIADYAQAQIYFTSVNSGTIQNDTVRNSSRAIQRGIWLTNTGLTTITGSTAYNAAQYDIQLDQYPVVQPNTVRNTVIGKTYPTNISFDYGPAGAQIGILGVTAPTPDTAGLRNIHSYVDIVNTSAFAGTWGLLNISYTDAQAWGTDDYSPTFNLYKSSGGGPWQDPAYWAKPSSWGSDPVNNYVWANMTNFSSLVGGFGDAGGTLTVCPTPNYPINMSGYWHLNQSLGSGLYSPCILVTASNVTLDGVGYTVSANSIFGAYADNGIDVWNQTANLTNVTVENLYVSGFDLSEIRLFNVANSSVINNTIDAFFNNSIGGTEGIGLESNAYNITVANNSLIGNAILLVGVTSYGTSTNVHDNLIKNNTIYSTGGYRDTPPIPDLSPIQIWGSSNNTITNNNLTNYYHYGVSIFPTSYDKAENNLITNNTFKAACNINNYTGPVCFGMSIHSNNTNITNNVINSSGTGITVIMPVSNYMFITNNTLYNNPLDFDIYSGASFSGPSNITATNNTLGKTYPTNISFTLGGTSNIGVLIATNCTAQNASCYMTFTQPADPFGFRNVSKYVEVFTSGDTWLALNVSYSDSDLGYLNESRLVMAKHNATTWNANTSSFANNFGVDTVKNVVYANITDGSIGYPFAPLVPSCTNISQSNTNYELTTDLVGNATSGICIQVLATNITLDCAGYNLNGTYAGTTIGVYDNGYNNATIKNCNIRNYSEGIDLSSANNSNFINNTVNSNTDNGIQADHISSDTFVNNTANSNTQYGIYVLFGNNDTFTNNTFNSNGGGIRLESSGSSATNTLTNNTVNSNTQNGIYLRISPNTTLTNNNASLNSGWDFSSDDVSTNNKITNLTTNDTNSSFTYSGDILLKSATGTGKTDPTDYTNISHYLNITNNTNAWIFLNVSYKASDIPSSVSDNLTLKIWKYSSGQWWNSTYVGTPDTVDTTNKYVYANITNFSSIFAPMGSTAGVGNCMSLTAANSIYNLTTNLFGVQSGQSYCIDVTANNITLDCKGYSINGTTSGTTQGIWIGDYGNITIKNCNVRNYTSGLRIDDTDYGNSLIINNTFNNNTREGILANLGSNELIANNTAYGNTRYGIALESSFSNNTLLNNTFNSNGYHGFWIQDNPVILTNNTANSNGQRGFSEQGSYGGNIYTNNTANSNTYDGFFLYNTHNISLTNSTACNNPGYGIYVYNSYNNNITVSNASFNTWDFVSESSSTNNKITNLTTNDTTSSFTYVGEIYLKSASGNGLTDPTTRYTNISHYLNITGPTWAYINISYKDADVPAAIWNTSAIQIWKYSSGQWRNATYVGTPDSIDTTNKYVYANITNFSSIYAPLGGTNHLPNAPTLLNPPDNVYPPLTDRKPYLNWTIPTDADGDTLHFQIQLANDSGFSQLVINQSSVTDTTGFSPVPPVAQGVGIESYKVQNNLAVDKQYFWRARAYDGYDWGSWSATFSFNVTKKIECVLGQSLTSFGSTVIPGTAVNGTLNYADANNGTMYNISNTGNVNENITQWGTNMTCLSGGCSGDYIDVGNMSWKSNVTASNGTNMIYANKIKMTATEDLANPIATNLAPTSAAWYRQWLATRSNQGGGSYNGTYTQQCIAS